MDKYFPKLNSNKLNSNKIGNDDKVRGTRFVVGSARVLKWGYILGRVENFGKNRGASGAMSDFKKISPERAER